MRTRYGTVERKLLFDEERELGLAHRVDFKDLTREDGIDPELDDCIRIYGGSAAGAIIQLRGNGPINERGNGKPRRMMATADYIDGDELDRIISKLQKIRKSMRE